MSFPDKLLEKAFYWSPFLIGVISLIIGVILVEVVERHDGEVPLAHLKFKETPAHPKDSSIKLAGETKVKRSLNPKERKGADLKIRSLSDKSQTVSQKINKSDHLAPSEKTEVQDEPPKKTAVAKLTPPPQRPQNEIGERTVQITIPQLVSLQGVSLITEVPSTLAGLEATGFASSSLVYGHVGSQLSQWGPLTQDGLENSVHRAVTVAVMAKGNSLGNVSEPFLSGLDLLSSRARLPLTKHYAQTIGQQSNRAYLGFDGNKDSSQLVVTNYFKDQGKRFGKITPTSITGFEVSLLGSGGLAKMHKIAELGKNIGLQFNDRNVRGLNASLVSAEKLKLAALALTSTRGKSEGVAEGEALAKLPCSKRYYAALQGVRNSKISSIRSVAKPISKKDKTLPGRWIFSPPNLRSKSVCRKYKYYHSGRKKCIKWRKLKAQPTAFTEDEKSFILQAQKIISGQGRHPMVKPRSPSHWVINIVAQNLNSYSNQKSHPAICTGALGMVDYFEGNLKRFKGHMMEIATLHEQSKAHILNHVERFNASLRQTDDLGYADVETASFTQYEKIRLSSYDPQTVNGQAVAALFGEDVGLEILSRNDFIQALKLTKTVMKSRKEQLDNETYKAFQRLTTILEASYYIERSHKQYQELEVKLFGSLRDIRTAHSTHCNCSN